MPASHTRQVVAAASLEMKPAAHDCNRRQGNTDDGSVGGYGREMRGKATGGDGGGGAHCISACWCRAAQTRARRQHTRTRSRTSPSP